MMTVSLRTGTWRPKSVVRHIIDIINRQTRKLEKKKSSTAENNRCQPTLHVQRTDEKDVQG